MNLLKNLDHPNIIKVYELLQDAMNYYIVTEYFYFQIFLSFSLKNHKSNDSNHIFEIFIFFFEISFLTLSNNCYNFFKNYRTGLIINRIFQFCKITLFSA